MWRCGPISQWSREKVLVLFHNSWEFEAREFCGLFKSREAAEEYVRRHSGGGCKIVEGSYSPGDYVLEEHEVEQAQSMEEVKEEGE